MSEITNEYAHVLTALSIGRDYAVTDFGNVFVMTTRQGAVHGGQPIDAMRFVYMMHEDADGNDLRIGYLYEIVDHTLRNPTGPHTLPMHVLDSSTRQTFEGWVASRTGISGVTFDSEVAQADDFEVDEPADEAAAKPFWLPNIGDRVRFNDREHYAGEAYVFARVRSFADSSRYDVIVTHSESYRYDIGDIHTIPLDSLEPAPFPRINDGELNEMIRDYFKRQFDAYQASDIPKHLELVIRAQAFPNTRDDMEITCTARINYENVVTAPTIDQAREVAQQRWHQDQSLTLKRLPRY